MAMPIDIDDRMVAVTRTLNLLVQKNCTYYFPKQVQPEFEYSEDGIMRHSVFMSRLIFEASY